MESVFKTLAVFLGSLILIMFVLFGTAFLFAFPVKWLWNWVIVDVFYLDEISYWQAFGLYLIAGILFKNNSVTTTKD